MVGDHDSQHLVERAIERFLRNNHMVRMEHGLVPFFRKDVPRRFIGHLQKSIDDIKEWDDFTFVVSYRQKGPDEKQRNDYGDGIGRHGLVALRKVPGDTRSPVVFFDSNGHGGLHARRLVDLCPSGTAESALILPVQGNVQTTSLWKQGQLLAKYMGWCSLFALTCTALVIDYGFTPQLLTQLLGDETTPAEHILVLVRDVTVGLFHRVLGWYKADVSRQEGVTFSRLNEAASDSSSVKIFGRRTVVHFEEFKVRIGTTRRTYLTNEQLIEADKGRGVKSKGRSLYLAAYIAVPPVFIETGIPIAFSEVDDCVSEITRALKTLYPKVQLPPVNEWRLFDDVAAHVNVAPEWLSSSIMRLRNCIPHHDPLFASYLRHMQSERTKKWFDPLEYAWTASPSNLHGQYVDVPNFVLELSAKTQQKYAAKGKTPPGRYKRLLQEVLKKHPYLAILPPDAPIVTQQKKMESGDCQIDMELKDDKISDLYDMGLIDKCLSFCVDPKAPVPFWIWLFENLQTPALRLLLPPTKRKGQDSKTQSMSIKVFLRFAELDNGEITRWSDHHSFEMTFVLYPNDSLTSQRSARVRQIAERMASELEMKRSPGRRS